MDYEKEREKQAAAADVEADVNVADAVDEVMKKYDRESNTRIWEGKPKLVVKTIMALFSLYCIIVTLFVSGLLEVRLTMFLGLILIIGYLNYPVKKGYMKVNYILGMIWLLWCLAQAPSSTLQPTPRISC